MHVTDAYRRCRAHAAPPRPDVLLGHAPPAARRPARDPRALRLRAHRRRDRRRPGRRATRRRAARRWTPGRPSCERGLRRGALAAPGGRARSSTPAPATTCRSTSCARYMGSMRVDCAPVRIATGTSSTPTWTAPPARSGGSWRRCSARRPSADAELGRLGRRVPADELHPRRRARTGALDRIYLPGLTEDDLRAPRRDAPRCASASPSEVAPRARAVRRRRRAGAACCPAAGAPGVRLARARSTCACSTASSATATTCSAARAGAAALAAGARGRGAALDAVTRRATLRGERAHVARRRRAPTCWSAARASPGSPSRASSPAAGADVLVVDRYEIGERATSACACPTPWLHAMGVAGAIRQELPCMALHTPHGAARYRLPWSWSAFDYRDAVRRCCGRSARRALRDREGRRAAAAATSSTPTAATSPRR